MGEKLTPQQEMAIQNRGGKLLVSAAAGSGKTKVLVDRLLSYVLDPVQPANLDDFLMITYTKAAASELRGKIAAKLSERLAQMPENRHLQRQMQRLYLAKISTVHGFCGDILREYVYRLDLPADFRVADENECRELRDRVMEQLLEKAYENAADDLDFRAFVDAQGLGRDDRLVPEILLRVYDAARCHLDPEKWLDSCVQNGQVEEITDAGQTIWGCYLMDDLRHYLDLQIQAMDKCASEAAAAEGMEKPAGILKDTVVQLLRLRQSTTWDEILQFSQIDYGRLVFSKKCPDQDLADRIRTIRAACKKGLEKRLKSFSDYSSRVLSDMTAVAASARGVVSLVRRFDEAYSAAKRVRRVLDFGDLEHKTLDLLLGKSRSTVTAAASELADRFREIMVDEYQDSNAVQDAIFSALTQKKKNCFMVGDVKQSIYQFRLADPGIFLEKYHSYQPAEEVTSNDGRKVMLSCNFRSGGDVLKSVNDVFSMCMSPGVGGLHYGEEEALREGIAHQPLGEPEVELWAVDVQSSTYEEEAGVVANRIAELLDGTHMVRQADGLRPIQPDDIAILLRSPGSVGIYYQKALESKGIRCVTGSGNDLLQTEEISVLRSMLQIISNPRQDIPLLAVLASPVFAFTADELVQIRAQNRRCSIYEVLREAQMPKAREFVAILQRLRREARLKTLSQLVEQIFLLTKMDSIFAAMDNGAAKLENLQCFYQLSSGFESTMRRDLEQFLDHLDAMEEKGLLAAGEEKATDAVTLMSIHKSKGLEFPVVFVSSLSREFNRESVRAQVLCDQNLGLGFSYVDTDNRVRYPTVAKRAIAAKTLSDSLSEELRVLYVALTRARDRLIMTYASQTLQKDIQELAMRMDMCDPELLAQDVVCPGEWVLMTALKRTEAGALFALGGRPRQTALGDPVWKIDVVQAENAGHCVTIDEEESASLPECAQRELEQSLSYIYAHSAATIAPSKQTATQRKGRILDSEIAENAAQLLPESRTIRKISTRGKLSSGKDYGSVMHTVLQHICLACCDCLQNIRNELLRLKDLGYLSDEQINVVDVAAILAFFKSEIGKKLRTSDGVLREFKFSILDDGSNYGKGLEEEKILLQGVVDCALIEPDGITVIDFKTDYVTEETVHSRAEAYRTQVITYADALNRIYQKPIKQIVLHFFHLNRSIHIKP